MKRLSVKIIALIFFVSLVCHGWAAAVEVATIKVSDLNVRKGPGKNQAILFRLAKQTQVRVLAHQKGWLRIEHHGRTGYILDDPRLVSLTTIEEPRAGGQEGAMAGPAGGQTELKDLNRRAEILQEKLEASQSELADMARREKALLDDVNAAELALDNARRQVRQARAELDALQEKVTQIERQTAELEKEIEVGQAYASQRLVALYKLNWVGRIQLLATAGSFFDFVSRKSSLERILAQDEAGLEKLRSDQVALETLLEQLNAGKAEKRASEIALNQRIGDLNAEQQRRTRLLDGIRSEKKLKRVALQALKQAARNLDNTIDRLEPMPPPKAPAGGKEGAKEGPRDFAAYKGLLSWPVKGKIVSFFGPYRDEKSDVVNFQSGIDIKAERGEPIRAVADGYAIFANWFKGFGNMLIIDHGDHYYTVYAHLEEFFKVKGDRVEKDEVIATVGDSGSLAGPALHFEVRYHGKPVDPLHWMNKG